MPSLPRVRLQLLAACALRLALAACGLRRDAAHPEAPYTDVDYAVFTDAAAAIDAGGSPYDRATYRYPPLLALLLLPNVRVWAHWGKLLFCAADVGAGAALAAAAGARGGGAGGGAFRARLAALAWLFNPYTVAVSTRGSCDALATLAVALCVLWLVTRRTALAAAAYAFAVHLRLYPAVYAPALLLFLDSENYTPAEAAVTAAGRLRRLCNAERLKFAAVGSAALLALCGWSFWLCGDAYVKEALLHHVRRADPRHNFSPYWYPMHLAEHAAAEAAAAADSAHALSQQAGGAGGVLRLAAFLPQLAVVLLIPLALARDLPLCLFAQTAALVALNKVATAQYFAWWFALAPLCAGGCERPRVAVSALGAWTVAQVHWLGWGYSLEMRGADTFMLLWVASAAFAAASAGALAYVLSRQALWPVFERGGRLAPAPVAL